MKKLTISIVNYNAGDYLIACLDSIRKVKNEVEFDVFVVDNASSDGSNKKAEKKFPEFNFINNTKNLGFGKAHNLVLKRASTKYVLTLNPDSMLEPGVLSHMVDFMDENSDVGASSCRVEKADGSLDIASHRGFPTPLASFMYFFLKNDKLYHLRDRDMSIVHEVDSLVGAFMMLRKEVLEKVGYFDEDYFLYGEDIDLCYRIKEKGYKVMYVPTVKITHIKGISSGIKEHSKSSSRANSETKKLALNYFYQTMIVFYKKHYAKKYPFFFNWLVYGGINLKRAMARRRQLV